MTSEVPPKEMRGKGTPVTGSVADTAPMFTIAWAEIQAVTPAASSMP